MRPNRRSAGKRAAVTLTTTSVASPPNTTLATAPISCAVTPDSNAPISFDEPTKTM